MDLLQSREMTQRALAELIGVGEAYMSKVLRGDEGKYASASLVRRVADALSLPDDYFVETRLAVVIERLARDPELVTRIYRDLRKHPAAPRVARGTPASAGGRRRNAPSANPSKAAKIIATAYEEGRATPGRRASGVTPDKKSQSSRRQRKPAG